MRPALNQWLLAGLLLFLSLSIHAQPLAYGVGFRDLYRIDLATGAATRFAQPLGFNDVEGLALSPSGVLYGAVDTTIGNGSALTDFLIRIDTTTGEGRLVGPLQGLAGMGPSGNLDYGLAFTADGRLWLSSDTTFELWEVNPASGAVRLVGNTGKAVSGLAGRGNELFGVTVGSSPELVRIDRESAQTRVIGALNIGVIAEDAGLDFDSEGTLWVTLDPQPASRSRIAKIDLTSGRATVVATVSTEVGIEGLAISAPSVSNAGNGVTVAPVIPIPVSSWWSIGALMFAVAALAAARLRHS